MKKTKLLLTSSCLMAAIIVTGALLWRFTATTNTPNQTYVTTKYGAFLAAQHAIYKNDFDAASKFATEFGDRDLPVVKNTIVLTEFLAGRLPTDPKIFDGDTNAPVQLVYDAYSITKNNWKTVWAKHKKDESTLAAPLRIWSGVATGNIAETLKFVDTLKTNESWKSFVRGQIYAETGRPNDAADQFAHVSTDFMNINDYIYIMAFYDEYKMSDASAKLRADFTSRPGGMFMLVSKTSPKWSDYSGFNRALAFSLIQNVSHTQIMMYSDLSLMLLRFAEIVQGDNTGQDAALNYYLGQYFFNNGGDYNKFFDKIDRGNPYYLFAMLKTAEKAWDLRELERAVDANPLFVPAIVKLVAKNVQAGDQRAAIKVVDRALDNPNITAISRAFFLKTRAQVNLTFGDTERAQSDIRRAADILPVDAGILAIQSRIWSSQKREVETAYEYAIALVHKNPTDIEAWDVLGMAVWAKDGATDALEVLERVGQVSNTCSSLFEHLGDLYAEKNDSRRARDAYLKARDLSDDGLTVIPLLDKKLKGLK